MLDTTEKNTLLNLAAESVQYGVKHNRLMPITLETHSQSLQHVEATFVTLNLKQQLRGCIGTLEAHRPLLTDVIENAYAAAFRDPRFSPVNKNEVNSLEYHISILKPAVRMNFVSEDDLLQQLEPNIDGLIFKSNGKQATFLPSVWEQLPKPRDFLNHLKQKAGFNQNYWLPSIEVSRYHVEEFS